MEVADTLKLGSACERGDPGPPRRPKCKTGPVLPPAPSEVPAGVSRPRSVPNRVPEEQAPLRPDPGQSGASSSPSLQTFTRQAPLPSVRTSFRQAGDHPRTSFRQAGDCPFAALFPRANPASRPSVSLRANPSRPVRSPFEQALQAAFRDSLARRRRFRRTPEKWVRLWVSPLPRASSRLPHQSVLGFLPEGYRPSRHWRRLEFLPRCRLVTPDRERSECRARPIRTKGIWGLVPVDNGDNGDKSPEPPQSSARRQSVASSRCFRSLASSWPRRTDSKASRTAAIAPGDIRSSFSTRSNSSFR